MNQKPNLSTDVEGDGRGFFTPFPIYGDEALSLYRTALDAACFMMMPWVIPYLTYSRIIYLWTPLSLR
ncbi:hypothetical protein HYS79_00820 [Patescibacteria group bacterium]|nr:hypothetical protein [Patescibacteria group bacterium]